MTIKKKKKLYRPIINKKNYNTPGRYSRFMNQSIDLNDWGFQKKHFYDWPEMNDNMVELNTNNNNKHQLKGSIKYCYTYVKGKPFGTGKNRRIINTIDDIEELNKNSYTYPFYEEQWNTDGKITMHKQRWLCMERHLLAAQYNYKAGYLFYTTSPNKDYNIICLDIDDIQSDQDYYNVVDFLSSIFPGCYYERSTNGTGLHFYIIVYFPPTRYLFSDVNEGVYRNVLYYLLSEALRPVINDNFSVKFDAVKGTNTLYDINNNFLKYGTLVKLPAPVTYEQFNALYSSSVFPEDHLFRVINYFNDITCSYSSGVYSIDSLISSLSSILINTPVRTTPSKLVSLIQEENSSSSSVTNIPPSNTFPPSSTTSPTSPTTTSLLPTTITNGGTNCLPEKKVENNCKNKGYKKYTITDIMNIGDSRVRESLYIKKYVGDHYSKHGERPSKEVVESHYRKEMNYNKVGDFREKRFAKYYKHTIDTFDIDKASDGANPYKIGMYEAAINQTNEQITEWINNNTSYKRNVYTYDVDITLEYIFLCSKNKKNRARELLIKKYAKQEGISEAQAEEALANTTPRNGLIGFYQFVKEKYGTISINGKIKKINLCDRKKATALLDYVVELGLAQCIDDTSDYNRARKFKLSEEVSQIRESWNSKETAHAEVNNEQGLVLAESF